MEAEAVPEDIFPPNLVSFCEVKDYYDFFGPKIVKPMLLRDNQYPILNTNYVKVDSSIRNAEED